ncbi:MAG: enoyl-CoA hydratase/isomerase family protein [Acidimicrobiales bacterium]
MASATTTPAKDAPFTTITATADGRIGRLTLNRPEKLNPLSTTTLREIAEAARWFDAQSEVSIVIVTGAGRSFSAGADLSTFSGPSNPDRDAADAGRLMADALESMRALAVVALQGWCVGGGLVVALACDIRVAADDARFSIPEVDLGIPLAWGGIPRMVREIGPALTKELVLTCRPFDAAEGRAAGFINEIVPAADLHERVETLAAELAAKAPLTIYATKRHVNAVTEQMVGTNRSWSDADSLVAALGDPDCRDARRAYLASRS